MRGKEQHRSLDWIMFLSADKKTIEYMFLTELTLCFDGHEAVEVKALNKTFTSPNFFVARKSARAAMEEYMGKSMALIMFIHLLHIIATETPP